MRQRIEHIAQLAGLSLTKYEIDEYNREFEKMLDLLEKIDELALGNMDEPSDAEGVTLHDDTVCENQNDLSQLHISNEDSYFHISLNKS